MPGLTFAWCNPPVQPLANQALGGTPSPRTQVLLSAGELRLFVDTIPGQPLTSLAIGPVTAVLDGTLYGMSPASVERKLSELGESFRSGGSSEAIERVRRWSDDVDGEFVIALINDEEKHAVVITDALGRLPLYWRANDHEIVISRVAALVRRDGKLDRVAGAEQAWLRYPLEDRTLIEGVQRTPPAAAITVSWVSEIKHRLSTYHQWNFSTPHTTKFDVDHLAGELAEQFKAACLTRSTPEGTTALLSLSGGLDSRAVAAGLAMQSTPMQAHTYSRSGTEHDVSGAREIASILGFSWNEFALTPSLATQYRSRVVSLTEGLNHAQMGFILEFFDHLSSTTTGPSWYFTGDGGDRVLPDLLPPERPRTFDELIRVLESRFTVAPSEVVERAFGIDRGTLTNNLRAHVAGYPEEHLDDRIVHFMVMQMAYKWLFEGENRNRHYFWSVSPFFNRQFFTAALAVPLESKRNYALYHSMLGQVNRQIAEIPFAGRWNLPMSSLRWKAMEAARGYIPLFVRDALRQRRYKGQSIASLDDLRCLGLASGPTAQLLETDAAKYLLTQALLSSSLEASQAAPPAQLP
jgi:asparagine synthase (glutamine-hydrolysing)